MKPNKPPIILWDVHEVLFTRRLVHWVYKILVYPHKWRVIQSLDWHVIKLIILYILHITHIKRTELSSQELVDYARKTNKPELLAITVQIACEYTPIESVIAIVKQLHNLGYTQHIGSNLGSTVFAMFQTMYPDIFCYFDVAQLVHYQGKELIKKPDSRFFTDYCIRHHIDPTQVIFIDDKSYNVESAQSIGMHGITYQNAEQIIKALENHQILIGIQNN
ncbi:MAG TPA: HAD-IA family hydrolase [Candidatus Babeliales bacterium]|jgi:FMN phosphatase YigB (HAD superfamily)|nr:HAD-IA family hydrolase [Candidatus Babeliales bacterium]